MLILITYNREGFCDINDINSVILEVSDQAEFNDIQLTLEELNIEYNISLIKEPIWHIAWFDDIDEEWQDIWSTSEEEHLDNLAKVKEAEVEYEVRLFNMDK